MRNQLNTYILGYLYDTTTEPKNLVEFSSKQEAAYKSEEWCEVKARSLSEARFLYESTFKRLKKQGKISGAL